MSFVKGPNPCPKCRSKGNDRSGNNFHFYGDGLGGYCWSCGYTVPSDEWLAEYGESNEYEYDEEVMTKEKITREEIDKIKTYTGVGGKGYRGISDETYKKYSIRHQYDEETGEVTHQYYGITQEYEASGFKIRQVAPKDFRSVGVTGKHCELFGQVFFKNASGKYVVVCSGELDALSAYEMLNEYNKSRGSEYEPVPCVSATIGESGSHAQLQLQYSWLDRFDKILLIPDQDAAGQAAVEKIAKVLPRGKLFIVNLPEKDTNVMLTKGKQKAFVSSFYDAVAYTPAGIVGSDTFYKEIVERAKTEKITFPPMLDGLNRMLAGGIPMGYICNILAGSGSGKTTICNEWALHLMFNSSYKLAVVSLEADAAEYGENLLSRFVGKKISMLESKEEKIKFLEEDQTQDLAKQLFVKDNGEPRILMLDDRGDYDKLTEKIEELIVSFGVNIILIDVVSDVFAGMSLEQVDKFMQWEKRTVKQYGCVICNIAHTRKGSGNEKSASQGAMLTEESLIGSGSQYRSAGVNIILQRDKMAEDEVERNTVKVHLAKNRACGITGLACELYYDNSTHTLHNKEEWLAGQSTGF